MAKRYKIDTKTSRQRLPIRKEAYWESVVPGYSVGYRRQAKGDVWCLRIGTGYTKIRSTLGSAEKLTYEQAKELVLKESKRVKEEPRYNKDMTVRECMSIYKERFRKNPQAFKTATYQIDAHILPKLGALKTSELTLDKLERWRDKLAETRPRAGKTAAGEIIYRKRFDPRARKETVNRLLKMLKAAVNHCYKRGIIDRCDPIEQLQTFKKTSVGIVRFLSKEEQEALLKETSGQFTNLVKAALYTGARYGELIKAKVEHVDIDSGTIFIPAQKSARARHVALYDDGLEFFKNLIEGKNIKDFLLRRDDGKLWGQGHQRPLMVQACIKSGVTDVSFHILRHTFASNLAMNGVSLQLIANQLGHADTRITEKHYAHLCPDWAVNEIRQKLARRA